MTKVIAGALGFKPLEVEASNVIDAVSTANEKFGYNLSHISIKHNRNGIEVVDEGLEDGDILLFIPVVQYEGPRGEE